MNDLISVVVAVYNIEKYIGECVDSILAQSYKELEIILVDDGSRDSSGKLCDEYAAKDNRIHVIHKVNGGLSDARNKGTEYAHGKYIFVLDGDDYIEPDTIRVMHDKITKENADLCFCGINLVDENHKLIENPDIAKENLDEIILDKEDMFEKITVSPCWYYVVAWNKLYKSEILKKVQYQKGKLHEDEFAIHDIINQCERFCVVKDKFYNYVQRGQSIMHKEYKVQRLDICEAFIQRAELFVQMGYHDKAFRTLVRMRTQLLDGYVRLRKNKTPDIKNRINELYRMFCSVYKKIDISKVNSDKIRQMSLMSKSLTLAIYTSGNYWHNR
ncbi:MAG: glycosyltransferase family 2 protein [Lachnospiraceae bacterium]|nr:glycosyltransferase family 2 protein [Lachnospiraceae bacterium]